MVFLCLHLSAMAQVEWIYAETKPIDGWALEVDQYGNIYEAGSHRVPIDFGNGIQVTNDPALSDFLLAKYNSDVTPQWVVTFPNEKSALVLDIEVAPNGDIFTCGNFFGNLPLVNGDTLFAFSDFINNSFLIKFDANGNYLWSQSDPDLRGTYNDMAQDENGNIILADTEEDTMTIRKLDSNGILLWEQQAYSFSTFNNNYIRMLKIETDKNNNIFLFGQYESNATFNTDIFDTTPAEKENLFLAKYAPDGTELWVKNLAGPGADRPENLAVDKFGNAVIIGRYGEGLTVDTFDLPDIGYNPNLMAKYDTDGNLLWLKNIGDNSWAKTISTDGNGNFYVGGTFNASLEIGNTNFVGVGEDMMMIKVDDAGDFIWMEHSPGESSNGIFNIFSNKRGVVYTQGICFGNIDLIDGVTTTSQPNNYLLGIFNDLSYELPNTISGNIFGDNNINCALDAGELPLKNWLVVAEPGPHYALSNAQGEYTLRVDSGMYEVKQIVPAVLQDETVPLCNAASSYTIFMDGIGLDTTGFEFPNDIEICQKPFVNIISNRRRRCFKNTTAVGYGNYGLEAMTNVTVEVNFPDYVVPLSASVPWSFVSDSLVVFDIGDLDPGETGVIIIRDSVLCDAILLQSEVIQCTSAEIFPKSNCPDPNPWNGASLVADGACLDDFTGQMNLIIKNESNVDMIDSVFYRLYQNTTLAWEDSLQLPAGDSIVISLLAEGSTIRLEVQQVDKHPDNDYISLTIPGCGNEDPSNVQAETYVNYFPVFYELEMDEHCLPVTGAYDPNDKQVFPSGWGNENNIYVYSPLEYLVRFQNTGNDTAFTVVIVDTLSEHLDLATLEFGPASHPVRFELDGNGVPIVKFIFENILLPDSTTNEPASHGFVSFRILPKEDLPLGTRIENLADIYFDFNPPIRTNTVFNTIADDIDTDFNSISDLIIIKPINVGLNEVEIEQVRIFPNPAHTALVLETDVLDIQKIEIYDANGILYKQYSNKINKIMVEDFPAGLYWIVVKTGEGKIVRKFVKM